jgi:hypothetical protein
MKKFITFCVAVVFGTMLLNSPVLSEASKIPAEMGVDESQDKELMDEQKKNEGSGTKSVPPANPPIIQKWPGFFDCGPTEVMMGIVNGKYNELPMIKMDGVLQIPGGRTIAAPTVIYFNQEKNTFSVVAHFNNGFSCIILYGHNVGPAGGNPAMAPGVQQKKYFDREKPPKEFKIDKKEFKWRGTGHTDILV